MNYISKLFYICILSLGSLLVSCDENSSSETVSENNHDEEEGTVEFTKTQYDVAGIKLGKIELKQISGTVKVNGVLDVPPQQLVNVSVPLGGFLRSSELLEGSNVKKGQVIAIIENLEFIQMQQDYLEAKSQFEFAETDYTRQQELAKENVNATKTLQQAKSNYQTWQAKANGLREKLKMININLSSLEKGHIKSTIPLYAPITGYVTEVNVNIGKFVNPSDVLFEIVDTHHLHAELIVFEKDIPRLKLGQKVRFTLANETAERMATLYLIGRKITSDRTIQIHCHIDKEDTQLLPGMYLKALVETGNTSVAALPDEAIIDYQGKKYIFVLVESEHLEKGEGIHFKMIEIEIGNSELEYTEVTLPAGLTENSEIVVNGAYSVLSKMKNSEEEGH